MYTQCPECGAAFRVTAQVLKQAGGMVRCGGCSHAFNALDFLSEEKPAPKEPEIPELMPELPGSAPADVPGENTTAYVKAITDIPEEVLSPSQSEAMRETLDAMSDVDKSVRIEDTGVEWRVLDDETADEDLPAAEQQEADSLLSDPGVTSAYYVGDAFNFDDEKPEVDAEHRDVFESQDETIVDEAGLFDGSSTSIDEILNEAPTPVDAVIPGEEFHGPDASADELVSREDLLIDVEELDEEPFGPTEGTIVEEALDESATDLESPEFGPDEGTIVEEGEAEQIEISEDSFDIENNEDDVTPETADPEPQEEELRFDDNTPLPDSFLDEFEEGATPEHDASQPDDTPVTELVDESLNQKIDLGDPNEWQSLLDDFGDLLATDLKAPEIAEDADDGEAGDDVPDDDAADWQEAAAADEQHDEALETEPESQPAHDEVAEVADDVDDAVEPEVVSESEDDDLAAESDEQPDEAEEAPVDASEDSSETELETAEESPEPDDEPADDASDESSAEEIAADNIETDAGKDTVDEDDVDETEGAFDELLDLEVTDDSSDDVYTNEGLPEVLDVAGGDVPEAENDAGVDSGNDDDHGFEIPPETEEEQTINRMIDQDLLAIAHQDEDGFTSTIVFDKDDPAADFDNITIETDADGNEVVAENASTDTDTEAENEASVEPVAEEIAAPLETEKDSGGSNTRLGLIAAVVCLGLGLGGQYVHLNRAALATSPAFAGVLMPLYDAIGKPITPDWDVSAWRFETSSDNFDSSSQSLTIDTRVNNNSDKALPYPIITVAITDIYLEPVGRLVLEPADYLDNPSVGQGQVSPGGRFETRIAISDLPESAENYRLNACYRRSGNELRCDNQDFR